jgi:hypothetical protein
MILIPSDMESIRPLSNDERLAMWSQDYYSHGFHRNPDYGDRLESLLLRQREAFADRYAMDQALAGNEIDDEQHIDEG